MATEVESKLEPDEETFCVCDYGPRRKCSVHPKAQPTIEELVFAFARFHAPACKIEASAITDGLMLLVQNAIEIDRARLVEQAELLQKFRPKTEPGPAPSWGEVAAWLRATAGEKGKGGQ